MTFKPMLAGKAPEDLTALRYPVLASPKLDGIRCIIRDGVAVSRNLKPIPNDFVREMLRGIPDGVDGELLVDGGFNACQSFFMRRGEAFPNRVDWRFYAFDWDTAAQAGHAVRLFALTKWSEAHGNAYLSVVEHVEIANAFELQAYEEQCLAKGFEGVMVRDPDGPYKYGRSTTREGYLLKIKRFETEEATVIGAVERMHNQNEATVDALGRTERSSAKAGMVPAGDLGALVCRTPDGAEFQIGSGFTAEERVSLWNMDREFAGDQNSLVGQTVTFKHQPDPGGRKPGQAPRFPIFLGFRAWGDMS